MDQALCATLASVAGRRLLLPPTCPARGANPGGHLELGLAAARQVGSAPGGQPGDKEVETFTSSPFPRVRAGPSLQGDSSMTPCS